MTFQGYDVDPDAWCKIRDAWIEQTLAKYPEGTWAPLKYEPTDEDLSLLGLPSREFLSTNDFPEPTMVTPQGQRETVSVDPIVQELGTMGPTVATAGGSGCLGIRPGSLVLLLNGGSIGWCSLAHVYGTAGAYDISTAGHCGKVGDTATVIAGFGNRAGVLNPILLDFGTFSKSTDGGIGRDWALIDIKSEWQGLVSPTMCFWGGPRGTYTATGSVVGVSVPRNRLVPTISVTPDPTLAQSIVHYGHGVALGSGGTPRAGATIHWAPDLYTFWGAISPGDSGSGSNALVDDSTVETMEAAGINTHIYVDPLMRQGVGVLVGTRATQVTATLADGQMAPYPAPAPGLP